ncbi:MAG: transcriptional repressor [Lachnospiraceae bacterium]
MIKYSRQRERIKDFLADRYDHPTAETVYMSVKKDFPNISLGTVYRNLSLLEELGEIQKISTGIGPDRFDGNAAPHYHFFCTECGAVLDLKMESMEHIDQLAESQFDGEVQGHVAYFFGKCANCLPEKKFKN